MLSVQLLYSNNNNAYVTWLINDRINFIRTNEAWCELACQGHQGNVFSREPHLLSKVIGREWKTDSDGHNAGFSRPSWGGPPWSGSTPASSSVVVAVLLAWWGRLLWRGKSGGWYPRNASKGEKLVAEDVRELYVYPSNVSCEDQEEGFWKVTQRRGVSSSLFSLSNWPGIWRWKQELKTRVQNKRSSILGKLTGSPGQKQFLKRSHEAWKHDGSVILQFQWQWLISRDWWSEQPWKTYPPIKKCSAM